MTDALTHLAAVERAVATETRDGDELRVQTLSREFRGGVAEVWDAVTSAERIPRWFLPISGELRLGGRYQLEGNAGGTVEECVPPAGGTARFRVTWEFGGGAPAWLTITLTEATPASTRLDLLFEGRVADLPAEMWDQFGPSATGMGWDSGLLGLGMYLDGGDDGITPEAAAAWVQTDEGRAFMRASADAWAAEHVAAGGDPAVARAAADATYAMYVGDAQMPA